MNLKPKDKKFESNLRLLSSCAKIQEIYIRAKASERKEYLKYLESDDGKEFHNFLTNTINRVCEMENITPPQIHSTEDLLNFLPHADMVPERYFEQYNRHRNAYKYESNYPYKDLQIADFRNLQTIIKEIQNNADNSQYDASDLLEYMSNPNHTKSFQNFSKTMLTSNPAVINRKYSHLAKSIAKDHDLYTDSFAEKLSTALKKPKLTLTMESLSRKLNIAKKLVPALALSSAILLSLNDNPKEPIIENPDTIETTHEADDVIDTNIIIENVGPISQTPALDSYEDACKDFLNKTAEVYKYNTGKDIDLSNYGQENIESASTKIYIADYNGKTYRFSSLSKYSANQVYLKTALEAAGATITETTSGITYIFDDDKSIAIVDSNGNPVRSGNILEEASGGFKEMYNQTYIHEAKTMLLEQGVEPINMSEAELLGKYILSDNYNIQNDELSIALGETSKSLLYHIENSFWKDKGEADDAYAIYLYEQQSRKFEQNFNEKAQNETQLATSKKDISDNYDER